MLARLFDRRVQLCATDPRSTPRPLLPEEGAALGAVAEVRRLEFAAGRDCARRAMRKLGLSDGPILIAASRAPLWPDGVVGSISHCASACAAAVALRSDGIVSLGLDLELDEPLDADLVEEICTTEELNWLDGQPPGERLRLAKLIFSAKEAAYKAQYPLSGCLFGFEALHVELDAAAGSLHATFRQSVPPFSAGDRLPGRFLHQDGIVATGVTLV